MTEREQLRHLSNEVERLINRYRTEYDMSYAAMIGVLQMKCWLLMAEATDQDE